MLLLLYSYYFDRGSDLSLDMNPLYLDISFTHVLVFLGLWSRERNRNFFLFPVRNRIFFQCNTGYFFYGEIFPGQLFIPIKSCFVWSFPGFSAVFWKLFPTLQSRGFCCADLFAMESSTSRGDLFLSTHLKSRFFVKYDAVIW